MRFLHLLFNFVDQIVVGLNNIENLRSLLNIKIIDKLDYPLFTNDDNLLIIKMVKKNRNYHSS